MGCAPSSCTGSGEDSKSRMHALVHEKKVMRKLLLVALMGRAQSRRRRKEAGVAGETNDCWLLADSPAAGSGDGAGYGAGAESHSVHSSFRFSFGSRVEVESFGLGSPAAAAAEATVLMVNLEKSSAGSPGGGSSRVRQVELLDRSVSSVDTRLIRFSYAEICSATQNFCRGKILGRGANSCVFRGRLGLRRVIAIKRLDEEDKDSAKAFYRELMIASSLDHPRIVPLVGFCVAPEGLFLVYKFVAGGSLESLLHDKKGAGKALLSWSARYKVALGIADAIAYLHNGTNKCAVHRDIKPSNILLSSRKRPKLCDFGLATWTPAPSIPFLCKTVKGTFGYLAPEYFQHGKVSDKTDVYAFGVVLLELLTGRKPIETGRGSGEENLVLWAKPLIRKGAVEELIDPRLNKLSCDLNQVTRLAQAARACLTSEESARPGIDQVVSLLRGREHGTPAGVSYIPRNGSIRCYFQSCELQANNEMKSHIALAMLGVTDFEEAELYCR